MIDFSPAYNEGLIVHCRTEEESLALFLEAKQEFRDIPSNLRLYNKDFIIGLHKSRRDRVAYRFSAIGDDLMHVSRSSIDWYREQPRYKSCKIIEYCNEIVDYGTISDDQIDISYLLGGDVSA